MVDRQTAVVCTSTTFCHCCGVFKGTDVINGKHCCAFAVNITFSGNQSCTECTHDSGNVRADRFTVRDFLKASKNCIIIEGTSLNNNMISEFGCVRYFDYLEQGILDNRISKSGWNVSNRGTFFLRLFNFGIHKYCTACSEINWVLCIKSFVSKILYRIIQRFRKCLNERTASGRAGFIQLNTVNGLIFDFDTFHILTANVQNTVYIRLKEGCRIIMRNSLNFSFIKHQSSFDQCFAVSCGTGMNNLYTLRELIVNIFDRCDRCTKRIPVVVVIEGIKKCSVFTNESRFCSCWTGIDSKKCFSFVWGKIFYRHLMLCMAGNEFLVISSCCKQWIQTFHFEIHLDFILETILHITQFHRSIFFGIQCRTNRSKQMWVIWCDNMFIIQF